MQKTNLLYLQDMYKYSVQAIIQQIINSQDGSINIVLDQTIFYPQGGGQPSDKGLIKTEDAIFEVQFVSKQDDIIYHRGIMLNGVLNVGQNVTLELDQTVRNLHSKLHTAGHVIDYALYDLGYKLESTKGYHFPNGSYVEYQGNLSQSEIEKLKLTLTDCINKIINKTLTVVVKFSSEDFYSRVMQTTGYNPIFCGGTHVKNTKDLGQIIIRKIKNEKDNLRISYAIAE